MRIKLILVVLIMTVLFVVPAYAERRHGVGLGYQIGTASIDVAGSDDLNFVGFMVYGKGGITDHWGVFASYRDMQDDEDLFLGEEDDYRQVGVHGMYMWRPDKKLRPHIRFGFAWTDLESRFSGEAFSDSGTGLGLGGGFEFGSPKIAFFLDYEFNTVELELVPSAKADFDFGNLTLGFIFKF